MKNPFRSLSVKYQMFPALRENAAHHPDQANSGCHADNAVYLLGSVTLGCHFWMPLPSHCPSEVRESSLLKSPDSIRESPLPPRTLERTRVKPSINSTRSVVFKRTLAED